MIISRRNEKPTCLNSPWSALKDTGWSDVASLLSKCMESMNVLCTEGPPLRIQGGMSDMAYTELNWRFGVHEEDASEDLMHEDSGAESESNGLVAAPAVGRRNNAFAIDDDECPFSEDGAIPTLEDNVLSVSVGAPHRFGRLVRPDDDPETTGTSPESTVRTSLPEILRKVKVKEAVLRNAIESLGGGVKGLQAVVEYVKHFQDANAGGANLETFTRGLERLCSLHGQAKPGSQNQSVNPDHGSGANQSRQTLPSLHTSTQDNGDQCTVGYMEKMSGYFPHLGYPNAGNVHPGESPHVQAKGTMSTNDSEMQHSGMRPTVPSMQMRTQEEWSRNGQAAGDPYAMGFMENMSGYFPGFCYPYPPSFAGYGPFNLGVRPVYMPMMQVPYFTPPSFEYVHKTDSITKASRKSRIARRRGHATDPHPARPVAKTVPVGGAPTQSVNHESAARPKVVSSSTQVMQGLSTRDLMLVLQKQLSPSGVSSLGRIVLPKKEAESHLPHLVASEGVLLTMTDFDTAQSWTFRYRFWSNNKSRMYLLENTRDFVKAHNLQERDMLSLYRDAEGSYVVRGEKNGSNQAMDTANEITTEEDAPATDDDLPKKKQKF